MLNKNELEKIVINSVEELKACEGKDLSGKYLIVNIIAKNIKLGILEGCVIEGGGMVCKELEKCNLYNVEYIFADCVHLSKFDGCKNIICGNVEKDNSVVSSQFVHCGRIMINDAVVKECMFLDFKILYLTDFYMSDCKICDVTCDKNCIISMENGEMFDISFENIELRKDSYLIEGYGDVWVAYSNFVNIGTSRKDYKIFNKKGLKVELSEKTDEDSFVDKKSCSGLDVITGINDKVIYSGCFAESREEGDGNDE